MNYFNTKTGLEVEEKDIIWCRSEEPWEADPRWVEGCSDLKEPGVCPYNPDTDENYVRRPYVLINSEYVLCNVVYTQKEADLIWLNDIIEFGFRDIIIAEFGYKEWEGTSELIFAQELFGLGLRELQTEIKNGVITKTYQVAHNLARILNKGLQETIIEQFAHKCPYNVYEIKSKEEIEELVKKYTKEIRCK